MQRAISVGPEKEVIFIDTDDGRDPDDIEAIAYLVGSDRAEFAGLATTHMIPDRRAQIARALMASFGYPDLAIGVGSVYPLGKEDALLVNYLREHTVDGVSYEGDGLIECFRSATDVIHDAIDAHGPALKMGAFAPLTDLAKAAEADVDHFCRIGGLFIQGQAIVEDGRLVPDPVAYNIGQDPEAAEYIFSLQDRIKFTLAGKHAAYQIPFLRSDFDEYGQTGHPAGRYLKVHAIKGMASFQERDPETHARIYGSDGRFGELGPDVLSVPYDAVAAKAMVNPAGMVAQRLGHHTLYGMSPEHPGILPGRAAAVKQEIHSTILHALAA